MNFEEQFKQAVSNKILKEISQTDLLQGGIPYQQRKEVPGNVIDQIWESINWQEVIDTVRPQIQTRICNSIVASMETETKTDIKKLLSVDGVRQKLRMEVYPKLMKVLNGGEK